ncbi:TonB-dependent siderophore receptor [Horticoccus sp. 23ND18S-11]|uniref:TonB-dependent siderophore receptor n=1 Tax=Horticoccus sp. 23ND18S-11 TaxID=3391832 RepID=UPI0039C93749
MSLFAPHRTRLLAALATTLALLSSASLSRAQSAPAPSAPAAKADELIELSPFEIRENADDKWNASNTLLGNRTNQELLKVPVTVDVMTRDFMNDIGVFSMDDAAAFVSGLTVTPRLEARNDNGRITFRGLSGSSNTSRNFFQWSVPSDTYNVERLDFGKGSNSLMFGDSTPGGQVMTTTKRARFINTNEAFASTDTNGSYRLQLDLNRKLTNQFALRVNGVNRSEKSYVKNSYQRFRAFDVALSYRPFANTYINLDAERGLYQRRRADNTAAIRDVAAAGRSFSTNNRWYVTSDGEVIQRTNTNPPLAIDRSGVGGGTVSLLEGQSVSVLLPNGTRKTFTGLDRSFNILGFGDYLDRPFNVVTAMLEQSFGKLSIQASYNQQFQHQDRNDNSFGGSATPPVLNVDGSGRPFIDQGGNLTAYKIFGNTFKAGRLSVAYPFEFGKWMKQFLVLTATRSKDYAVNRRFGLANTAAPGLAANNAVQFRAYLDDPAFLDGGGWNKFMIANLPRTATFTPEIVESYVNTGPFIDIRYARNLTASLSGEYFNGRLTSLIGISHNRISRKVPVEAAYATDSRGFITFFKTPEEAPEMFTYDPNFTLSAESLSSGLTYALIRNDQVRLNVYASYLQSFNWQSQLTFTGKNLGPITGTTREIGFKGELFRGKLSYAVAGYEIDRESAAFAWSPDSLSAVQLEDLFNPNNLLPADPKYFTVETGLNNERRTVNSQEKARGVEVTLFTQRVLGLQTRVTFSKSKVEATRNFSEFQSLLDAAIARTTAANAPGGDRTMAESAAFIASARDIVAANTDITVVTGRRSAPYTGSFAFDYQFKRPAGLRVGLTGVWTPDYNVAILGGVVYRDGASCPIGLYAMYDLKIFGQRTNFRLGLSRVYDLVQGNSDFYKTGANSLNTLSGKPNYIYRYVDPMTASLSATVRF